MIPLVSIVTPCYNGGEYVHRLLDSILEQSYSKLELIIVNDGSEDNTSEVINEYRSRFEEKGILLKYIYQENSGQAAAVENGLQYAQGEYLIWPDSDDFLMPDSIEIRVKYMQEHPEYGFVRSDAYFYSENDLTKPIKTLDRNSPARKAERIFDRLVFEQNMYSMSGTYMVRMSVLDEVIHERKIFKSRGGQNWQLQLPISYHYRGGYINKPLFCCVVRGNSHSRHFANVGIEKQFKRYDDLKEIILETVKRIDGFDAEYYIPLIEQKYYRYKFIFAVNHGESEYAQTYYTKLKEEKALRCSDRLRYTLKKCSPALRGITVLNKILFYLGFYYF